MKRSLLGMGLTAAIAATTLSTPAVASTSLSDCLGRFGGPLTHVVTVIEAGFFPTTTYVCPGDIVTFENGHDNWANFTIDYGSTEVWSGWQPAGGSYNSISFTVTDTMTDVEFRSLSAHPYYPNAYKGFIRLGVSPWELDDLDEGYDLHNKPG